MQQYEQCSPLVPDTNKAVPENMQASSSFVS